MVFDKSVTTVLRPLGLALAVLASAGCTKKHEATQSAARVDGSEITVHQINYRLQRERGLRPEQMEEAGRKVLEQLIDEQLFVDKAEKDKVDKEPGAQQAIDASRREVLARGYVETSVQSVPSPTDDAIRAYFDGNDALFTHRRIYVLQEYLARVPEARIPELRSLVERGTTAAAIEAWLKAQGAPFRAQQSTHPAEQVPLGTLKTLAALQDGHGVVAAAGEQVHVTIVTSSKSEPVSFDKAKPAIAQFLTVDARRKVTEGNLAALKTSAKIDYAPQYAALASTGPALATTKDMDATAQISAASGARITLPVAHASSGVQVTLPAARTSSERVTLPTTESVHVSLPATPASSAQVRLPSPTSTDTPQK